MKCSYPECLEEVLYFEQDAERGGWCDKHIKQRAPEYFVRCPKCEIEICCN